MRIVPMSLSLLLAAGASAVSAQEIAGSFDQLRVLLRRGDAMTVTDTSRHEMAGSIRVQQAAEAASLTSSGWARIQELPCGTPVSIELWTRRVVNGHVTSVTGDQLTVSSGDAPVDLIRPAIHRLALVGNRTVGRRARLGFVIGAVAVAIAAVINKGTPGFILIAAGSGGIRGATRRA